MNGFVRFDQNEALRRFLDAPELSSLDPSGRFQESTREPLVIFSDLSPEEVATVQDVASRVGGRAIEATRYDPF